MAYTVKQLSKLSGVTVRTLHYYEEEGLLKPAYYGSNGYRYYEEQELLRLQQILFFKELGFTIKQIKQVVGKPDFNQLSALYAHQKALEKEWEKIGLLLKTLDKTIKHLKGKKKMKENEIFEGFHISLVKGSKPFAAAEELISKSVKKPTKSIKNVQKRYDTILEATHAIFKELVQCIEKGLSSASPEVQKIIKKHHAFLSKYQDAHQEVYKAMALLYREHPEFRKQLDPFHPGLAQFMSDAMDLFADREL